uniref:Ku70/Ku80 N-terminal alpha/beta domain-containing protein n=1 Tax=Parascaris equorum TaxID=6256 RepID=A0A914RQG7_PAREQ
MLVFLLALLVDASDSHDETGNLSVAFEPCHMVQPSSCVGNVELMTGANITRCFPDYLGFGLENQLSSKIRCVSGGREIIRLQLVNKAVTSTEEYTAVIFINTANSSNNVDNVVVWQDVAPINADRVKQVDELLRSEDISSAFIDICGGHGKCDYSDLLFLCIKRTTTHSPMFQKRVVYLFTNESNPFGSSKQHITGAAKNAEDLRKHGAEFAIFPLLSKEEEFAFTFNILKLWFKEDTVFICRSLCSYKYCILPYMNAHGRALFQEQLDADVEKNCYNIGELEEDIPRKQYARRNISSIDFSLSNDVKLAVGIYSLIRPERIPSAVALDAESNEVVQRSFTYVRKQVGGAGVSMTAEEIEKLRRLTPPGELCHDFIGKCKGDPTQQQIDAARNVIRKLTLNYHPEKFSNPEPYFAHEAFSKRIKKELDEFRSLTLPDDYNPDTKKASKGRRLGDTSDFEFIIWRNAKENYVNETKKNLKLHNDWSKHLEVLVRSVLIGRIQRAQLNNIAVCGEVSLTFHIAGARELQRLSNTIEENDTCAFMKLKSLTVSQLKTKAAEMAIPFKSSAKKGDLIEAIEQFFGIQ